MRPSKIDFSWLNEFASQLYQAQLRNRSRTNSMLRQVFGKKMTEDEIRADERAIWITLMEDASEIVGGQNSRNDYSREMMDFVKDIRKRILLAWARKMKDGDKR